MLAGQATADGTQRYTTRRAADLPADHFRTLGAGLRVSSVGLGTYLGRDDDVTDALYQGAVTRAITRGVNVFDTAINYRHQRSERAIGHALAAAIARDDVHRDEVVIASKGGFIPFDGDIPRDPGAYVTDTYLRPGILRPDDVVGGAHSMAPRYLEDQIERSRKNLGVETIDVYFLHNPETQLDEVDRPEFLRRVREAFAALETAVAAGRIARYGTATWNGFRVDPGQPGYLSVAELVAAARDVGGVGHHFGAIQLPYNLAMPEAFTRANQTVGTDVVPMLEAARRFDLYVMASASVYQGQLTRNLPPVVAEYVPGFATDGQRALQFARSTPGIGTALVGMKSVEHVEENAVVARASPLAWEQFRRMFSGA